MCVIPRIDNDYIGTFIHWLIFKIGLEKSSACGPATVDRNIGSGDLRRRIRAQKHRQRCDLIDGDKFLRWLRFEQHVMDHLIARQMTCFHRRRDLLFDERRPDIAG